MTTSVWPSLTGDCADFLISVKANSGVGPAGLLAGGACGTISLARRLAPAAHESWRATRRRGRRNRRVHRLD